MTLSKREVVNALRKYRYDPEHRWAKQGRSMANVAKVANVDKQDLKKLRDHEFSRGPAWLARISQAVEWIENGEIEFVRVPNPRVGGKPAGSGWRIDWEPKPRRVPSLDRLHPAGDHVKWARCKTCHGDRWSPLVMNARGHYACRQCLGPGHWPALGARAPDGQQILALFEPALRENLS